jgi:hypothetical protein
MPISRCRDMARASIIFATFAQAISRMLREGSQKSGRALGLLGFKTSDVARDQNFAPTAFSASGRSAVNRWAHAVTPA